MAESTVFIAYAHKDQPIVSRYVEALAANGLTVWWDERVHRGEWDRQIDEKLNAAETVLVFLSQAAMESGNVLGEVDIACRANKLIPVWIERAPERGSLRGNIHKLHQYYFYEGFDPTSDNFRKLCRACRPAILSEDAPVPSTEAERVRRWFMSNPARDEVALCLAVAMLENGSYAVVSKAGEQLADIINPVASQPASEPMPFTLRHRAALLSAIEAECFRVPYARRQRITHECIRFVQPERAREIVNYAWHELSGAQDEICRWLDTLAATRGNRALQLQLADAVGTLAQDHFPVVFAQLIQVWALDDEPERRQIADLALCVAASDSDIRQEALDIVRGWVRKGASIEERRAAAELMTGYTGARFSEETMPILRLLVRNMNAATELPEVLGIVRTAIKQLFDRAVINAESNWYDVFGLIIGLSHWMTTIEPGEHPDIPIHFFLFALRKLPVAGEDDEDRFSLAAILNDAPAREACVAALIKALSRTLMHEAIRIIVNGWIELQALRKAEPNPLQLLRDHLLRAALGARDEARILHLFRHAGLPTPASPVTLTIASAS